jgi:hypothetical protein
VFHRRAFAPNSPIVFEPAPHRRTINNPQANMKRGNNLRLQTTRISARANIFQIIARLPHSHDMLRHTRGESDTFPSIGHSAPHSHQCDSDLGRATPAHRTI